VCVLCVCACVCVCVYIVEAGTKGEIDKATERGKDNKKRDRKRGTKFEGGMRRCRCV
jgi:hypothetical protein